MTGECILKDFFVKIHSYYELAIEDFNDLVEIDGIDTIIDVLIDHITLRTKENSGIFLENFRERNVGQDYLENDYRPAKNIFQINFKDNEFLKRHRSFSYSDSEFGFLSFKNLLKIKDLSDLHKHSPDFKVLLDYISTAIVIDEDSAVLEVLDFIKNSAGDYGILVDRIGNSSCKLQAFSYLYYKYLLGGGVIEVDSMLKYEQSYEGNPSFNSNILYQQYFEVFDIVNELNQANDIITRYLKLYHIIEYLVYRVELVHLEKRARLNKTFIREIHKLTNRSTSELTLLKNCLKKIFKNEISNNYFYLGDLEEKQCEFLKDYWGIEYKNNVKTIKFNNVDVIAKLIYGIRNSIVHNKESEFHLTITHPEEYAIIIPVIKDFMQKLEKIVLDKISNEDGELSYGSSSIELY